MVISVENFKKCCRCCLLTLGPMEPIFGSCLDGMLAQLMNLPVLQNDGYPQQMCSRCILKLSSAHTFYLTVKRSLKTLEEVLQTAAVENKVEELSKNQEEMDEDKELFTQTKETNIVHQQTAVENVAKPDVSSQTFSKELESGSEELTDTEECYQCPQCKHKSQSQEDLKVHLQTHLIGATDSRSDLKDLAQLCSYCGKRFRWRTSLCKHIRYHRGAFFQCKYCDKRFAEASTLKVHLVSHSIVNPKPFQCAVCKKHFSQKSSLKKHEQAHAADRKTHCCTYCGKSFFLKCSLRKHCTREHTAVACGQCNQRFTGERALAAHSKTHKADHLKLANIPGNLTIEETSVSNTLTDQVNVQTVTVEFLCLLCSNKFQSKERLEVHLCTRKYVS